MRIRTRLTCCLALVLVLTVGIVVPILLRELSETILHAEDRELHGYLEAVKASLLQRTDTAATLAELVAIAPETLKDLASGDRDGLRAAYAEPFARLKRDAGVEQFQFHTPPAKSFLRLHKPEFFGDDLEELRPMVVGASANGRSVKGLELGVAGLGARAVSPVFVGSELIGTVEFGMDFGQKFADDFKSRFGIDLAIYLPQDGGFRTVAATTGHLLADDETKRAAFDHETAIRRNQASDRPIASIIAAFDDYSGRPVAVIEIAMDASEFFSQYASAQKKAWGIGGIALIVGLAISFMLAGTISRPLIAMTEAMDRLAAGDLDVKVPADGRNDEIGKMSRAMVVFKQNRTEVERQRIERDQMSRLSILGEMASSIAHEVNQPLASISNYGQGIVRMLDQPQPDMDRLKDGALAIADQAERAAAIIRRVRGFVRRREKKRTAFQIGDLIAESRSMFEYAACLKGIAFIDGDTTDLPPVLADRVEVQQVLLNLYQNAVDVLADGGRIVTRTSIENNLIHVEIADNGPGLSKEAEDRLFDPFFTTKPDGLGLGLSICRTIIEGHGGALWATSVADDGATMHFTLPCESARES